MFLTTLSNGGTTEDNWEFLTHDWVKPNYHSLRWTGGQQRIPNGEPALSLNMLSLPGRHQLTPWTPPYKDAIAIYHAANERMNRHAQR